MTVDYDPRNHQRKGWTRGALQRDRRRWPYAMLLSDQHGNLIIETVHGSLSSLRMDVEASANRISEGKPNRGGQIPTTVDVMGVEPATWREWI